MDDRSARFEEVCRTHRRRLVAMLRRRTGDPEAAEDLAQETLLRAFRHLHRADPGRPIWPWLRAIALNRAATWAARQPATTSLEGVERSSGCGDILEVEEREAMHVLMTGLTDAQQRALWLRYVEDQDARRAAATLGLSVAAFKQLLYRARTRLRTILENRGVSVLAPLLAPLRALRRLVLGPGRPHTQDLLRVAEGLLPMGAAVAALFLIIGGASDPVAQAAPHRAVPIVGAPAGGGVSPATPGADEVRRPSTTPQTWSGVPPAASKTAPARKKTCAGGGVQACAAHGELPGGAPSSPGTGVRPRIPPMVQADAPLLGGACTEAGCVVDNPSPDPQPGPADALGRVGPKVRFSP
jgi:RNA polymerase sigma-70 factor (ECF subfamily)